MTSKRRIIRERVMQALYAYEISQQPLDSLIERNLSEFQDNKHDFDFGKRLLKSAIEHKPEFENNLKEKTQHWEVSRLAIIDKILIQMGMCELLYFDDIPPKVSINEMIEIAKKFSTDGSGKFINGILDAFLIEIKNTGQLYKTGRGKIDFSQNNKPDNSA